MTGRAFYIAIVLGFLRRVLRKALTPAGKRPGGTGDMKESALFLVDGMDYYVFQGTAHMMDDETADWLCSELRDEWQEYCKLVMPGLSIHVLHTGPVDVPLITLAAKLDSAARERLHCLVNGARNTYNDKWRRGK